MPFHVDGSTNKKKPKRLRKLQINRTDLVGMGANPGAHVLLFKAEEPVEKKIVRRNGEFCVTSEDGSRDFGCFDSEAAAQRRLGQIEGFKKDDIISEDDMDTDVAQENDKNEVEMSEQVEKTEAPTDSETVAKADFERVMKALEAAEDARKQSEERIAKMERQQRRTEFVQKAKVDFEHLGSADNIGGLLEDIASNVGEDTYKSLEQMLKAANAAMDKSKVFAQFGSVEEAASEDPYEKITVKAQELVESGVAKNLNDARLQVIKAHPELANEYVNARRSR